MPISKSSRRWLEEHAKDPYVKKARAEGYRSRAAYKLIELQDKTAFIKPGMTVVDLGAAPGGWTQLLVRWVGKHGRVLACDILAMDPVTSAHIVQGDFTEPSTIADIEAWLGEHKGADVVVSDMAPNTSGHKQADHLRAMNLVEDAYAFAQKQLKPGGVFVAKVFQGVGFDEFVRQVRQVFDRVSVRKPAASRARSVEVYLFAQGFKGILES